MQIGLLMRPLFEIRRENPELDNRDFTIHRPSAASYNAKVLVIRTKEKKANPCYPACSKRSFGGVTSFLKSGDNLISNVIHCRREGGGNEAF